MSRLSTEQFEAVYGKYSNMLYRLALSHLLSKEDAEDAVHEVFIKYMNSVPHFFNAEHEKAWFIRVTVNQCHDSARRRILRSHAPLEEAAELCAEIGAGEVTEAVLGLEDIYKTPVLLHYYEGYSVEECARILRVSVSAVKMRLARAREKLKIDL
ncbi:MAG: RNA polymerase sigma factor [Ruminococcaceae bacterium]|nr:RNA polymerase sigma factor [Oscillospiraceae bacterium]